MLAKVLYKPGPNIFIQPAWDQVQNKYKNDCKLNIVECKCEQVVIKWDLKTPREVWDLITGSNHVSNVFCIVFLAGSMVVTLYSHI